MYITYTDARKTDKNGIELYKNGLHIHWPNIFVDRNGAIISQVMKDSPAEDAGVKEQDVIIEVDGEEVNDSSNLKNLISSGRPNDKTKLTVIRDGREKNLTVTLGLRPGEKELAETFKYGEKLFDLLGLRVESYKSEESTFASIFKIIVGNRFCKYFWNSESK